MVIGRWVPRKGEFAVDTTNGVAVVGEVIEAGEGGVTLSPPGGGRAWTTEEYRVPTRHEDARARVAAATARRLR
ncbi:hypothetical protein CTZ27_03255 [Streptomyces griseocarneus]|nr:hypothetical protein CTZ27_03255 [Streptomyces griseocarneus]